MTLPTDGVTLDIIEKFVERNGGRCAFKGLTTEDVCNQFVKESTKITQCSYVELLHAENNVVVGKATEFISHAWRYDFLDVLIPWCISTDTLLIQSFGLMCFL
jgi:hypothetical protein